MPTAALYFPFSRCVDSASLKQQLLLFDKLYFLDPVEDEEWRAHLIRNLEPLGDRFANHREIHDSRQVLIAEGVLGRIAPENELCVQDGDVALVAASDLLDRDYVALAKQPRKYGLPAFLHPSDGRATWEIFRQKLPDGYLELLETQEELRHHLIRRGSPRKNWSLT